MKSAMIASVVIMMSFVGLSTSSGDPAWEVSGVWSEACPCEGFCPCWYDKNPSFNHCENVQVYQIIKGEYGGVPLDGVTVVVVWVTPQGGNMRQVAGNSKLFALYVDRSVKPIQREAVEAIWRNHIIKKVKANLGELRAVPIRNEISRDHVLVVIPGILTYEVKATGGQPNEIRDPFRSEFRSGISLSLRYADYGLKWDYTARHAAFALFRAKP